MIRAILACDFEGGIGRDGYLPWAHNKKDLAHFKSLTSGAVVVMGRGTWEGKGMPKPLPNRYNVVVTSDRDYVAEGADEVIHDDLSEHLTRLAQSNTVYVIGGGVLVNQLIDHIQIFHLTRITGNYNCDAFIDLKAIEEKFVKVDEVEIDNMTRFETYFTRYLNDLSLPTKF